MKATCGTCGTLGEDAVRFGAEFMQLMTVVPWRIRNGRSYADGELVPCMVLLCSDLCEERYGKKVGFYDDVRSDGVCRSALDE